MKVRGTVSACARPVRAPGTLEYCVGYELVVRRVRGDGSEGRPAGDSACADFELATDEGPVYVRASAASSLALRKRASGRAGDVLDGSAFGRRGSPHPGAGTAVRLGVFQVGDNVVVWGQDDVEIRPDLPTDGYRTPPMRRLIVGDTENPVVVSNLPGAWLLDDPFLSRRALLQRILRRRKARSTE